MNAQELLGIYLGIESMKLMKRRGWVLKGIANPESVADHVFGVSALAIVLAAGRILDIEKVALIAILHDMCEINTGDITPRDGISFGEQMRLEQEAAEKIMNQIDSTGYFYELWLDFAERRTAEGSFVSDVDALEMGLQALLYQNKTKSSLDEFYRSAMSKIRDPCLKELLRELFKVEDNDNENQIKNPDNDSPRR